MASVEVLNWEKKKVGVAELHSDVFEAPVRKDILHTVVRWQLACRRQGTAKTKGVGEVAGTGKKPFKQKGTGNARQGSTQSPLLRGGGVIWGPSPRDYSYTLPKKVRQMGLRSALSYLKTEGRLYVLDNLSEGTTGKTKDFMSKMLKFGAKKAVLVGDKEDELVKRASRNAPNFRYYTAKGLNVYDLLKYDMAVITKDSLEAIEARCGVVRK